MQRLVALDLPAGAGFVDAMRAAWDAGDAVLPLDRRLPGPARRAVLEALRPSAVVDGGGETALQGGVPVLDGDAVVVATSGTTGEPKGAVHTHDSIRASAVATSERLGVDPASDRWLACLPLAHIGGLSVVLRSLVTGTPYHLVDGFDAETVERRRPADAPAGTEATLVSLVASALARVDASAYRIVLLGGAAPPEALPANVVTTYGSTETGSGIVYDGLPLEGVEVRIVDGEIQVRCPMLLRAYRGFDPEGVDPRSAEGWFATGDGGELENGRLAVHGRLAEVINSGGEKVWPAALEAVLARHPGVAEVAVWKRPDERWGEQVVAWVVEREGGGVEPAALGELAKSEIGPWAAPKEVVVVESLPRTASGKVRRDALP